MENILDQSNKHYRWVNTNILCSTRAHHYVLTWGHSCADEPKHPIDERTNGLTDTQTKRQMD